MAGALGPTNIKHCEEVISRFELDIRPGTTESAVECNSTLDR
jgi:hypothetical protein